MNVQPRPGHGHLVGVHRVARRARGPRGDLGTGTLALATAPGIGPAFLHNRGDPQIGADVRARSADEDLEVVEVEEAVHTPGARGVFALVGGHSPGIQRIVAHGGGHIQMLGIPHDVHVGLVIVGIPEYTPETYLATAGLHGHRAGCSPLAQHPVDDDRSHGHWRLNGDGR